MEKKCSRCNKVKETGDFYKHKDGKDGLSSRCKMCISEVGKKRKMRNIELRNKPDFKVITEKRCSKCDIIKDVVEFHRDVGNKDGLHSLCKLCVDGYYNKNKAKISLTDKIYCNLNREKLSKRKAEYYKKNKEKINIRHRKYYRVSKEKSAEYGKVYYQDNKERISKRNKAYREKNKCMVLKREKIRRENNKDRIKEQRRLIYENNKEAIDIQRKGHRTANAKYDHFVGKLTIDESSKCHSDGVFLEVGCRYCGKYFIPSNSDAQKRVRALNREIPGDQYLYCSDNCKTACPVYNQKKYPKGFKKASSREVNSLVRQMCFKRDDWLCQICGKSIDEVQLHCHHIEGYAQNPILGNDIENVITLCKACHKEVHKLPGCNYHELRCS